MKFCHVLLTAASLTLTALAAPAQAGDAQPYPIVRGEADAAFGDLNLDRQADARTMLDRIDHAARQACGIMPQRLRGYSTNSEFVERAFVACKRRAVSEAVAKLNRPTLTAAYDAANGGAQTGKPADHRWAQTQPNH